MKVSRTGAGKEMICLVERRRRRNERETDWREAMRDQAPNEIWYQ